MPPPVGMTIRQSRDLEGGGDRLTLAGPELAIAHVGQQAVGVGLAFEYPQWGGLVLLDLLEALQGQSRLGLFVSEDRGSRQRRRLARRGRKVGLLR